MNRPASLPCPQIAFVQSCWHRGVVDQCRQAFMEHLAESGLPQDAVSLFEVPGVFELPLQAKLLAQSGRYAAIVAAGLVVDGGIYRHDFVSQAVINGLMQVQLETLTPVLSAVLTPHHYHGEEHEQFFRQHFIVKGKEAAHVCLDTIERIPPLKLAMAPA